MSRISWTVFDTLLNSLNLLTFASLLSSLEHPGEGLTRISANDVSHII